VPLEGNWWFTLLRSVLLMLLSVSMFVFGYGVSLLLHYSQMRTKDNWVPFRARVSPTWRRRIALLVGAVLLVLIYAAGGSIGYTLMSSISLAIGIALLAFIRLSKDESEREKFEIPDDRDTSYHKRLAKLREERAVRANAKGVKKRTVTEAE